MHEFYLSSDSSSPTTFSIKSQLLVKENRGTTRSSFIRMPWTKGTTKNRRTNSSNNRSRTLQKSLSIEELLHEFSLAKNDPDELSTIAWIEEMKMLRLENIPIDQLYGDKFTKVVDDFLRLRREMQGALRRREDAP